MIRLPQNYLSQNISITFWCSILGAFLIGFFIPRLMAYLPGIIGLSFFVVIFIKQRIFVKLSKTEIILFGLFFLLSGLSSLWSINPEFSLERTFKLIAIIVPAILLLKIPQFIKPISPTTIIKIIFAIHFIAALFLIFEQTHDRMISGAIINYELKPFQLNRSYIIFSFLSLVSLYMSLQIPLNLKKKIMIFCTILTLSLVALFLSESQTAQLTFLCGFFFLVLFPIKNNNLGKILFAGIFILSLSLPFILEPIQNKIPEKVITQGILGQASIIYRFDVWDFTITEINKNPIYGHGIESQRFMKADKWMEHQKADSILHAHNIILQIWIEFGIIGILLGCAFLLYFYKLIYRSDNLETRRLYMMVFVSTFCCAMTGYGAWQSWQVGAFFMLSAFAVSLTTNQKQLHTN